MNEGSSCLSQPSLGSTFSPTAMFRLKSFAPRCHGPSQSLVPHVWKGPASLRPVTSGPPEWWKRGWPRDRVGSMAEAELLSQLALLLRPRVPIPEMFRRFPAPEGWGGHYLDPDLAVYGVLRRKDAALFVEYDGYWRHGEEKGILKDERKNAALLASAPQGSWVVRLSHTTIGSRNGNILRISVSPWRQGEQKALGRVLQGALKVLLTELQGCFRPEVEKRLQMQAVKDVLKMPPAAGKFCDAAANAAGVSTQEEIVEFLRRREFSAASIEQFQRKAIGFSLSLDRHVEPLILWLCEIGLTQNQVTKMFTRSPKILSLNIEQTMKPVVQWLLELGLSKAHVAKAVAVSPSILSCRIEENLKPTVRWLLELGLSKAQVAKAVAVYPSILGYSIEENMKPTVRWLVELGLSKAQVAKAVAVYPSILGYSIEEKMKPTVRWLVELGLSKAQVAKAVAVYPSIMGYSIEEKMKPTVHWLLELGLSKAQVAKAVAVCPSIMGYSMEEKMKPTVHWLLELGLSKAQVAAAVAVKPQVFGYSLERNLKPKVTWLQDIGLKTHEISGLISRHPLLLGFSAANLKSKVEMLNDNLSKDQVANLIARSPWILGLRIDRFQHRVDTLARQRKTCELEKNTIDNAGTSR